ncbi:MAG: HD domain-containing protein [Synergistaceae bacterium]|jgi:guanosine-3',5'-bis(diphosphate) 3'-pyrophosphohydrolase|nr:HD domain-containing protein [Synergistaceae bacterium]
MGYFIRVLDNFHFADPAEEYDVGNFVCYNDALEHAKKYVREDIIGMWVHGQDINSLFSYYTTFGADPIIISEEPSQREWGFSAWDYAEALVEDLKNYLIEGTDIQTIYQTAILFAGDRHAMKNQTLPDSHIPYVVHLSNVCMEILVADRHTENFNLKLAVQTALLHDVLEDTETTTLELEECFGGLVTYSVQALTKDKDLSKEKRMEDSLRRIKECPKEVWAVKLADRITNMQKPPNSWGPDKISQYHGEAKLILSELREGNQYLANRLEKKIKDYSRYCCT